MKERKFPDEIDKWLNSWMNELYLLDKGVRSCCSEIIGGNFSSDTTVSSEEVLYELEQATLRRNAHFLAFKLKHDKDDSPGYEYWSIYACKYSHQIPLIKFLKSYKGSRYIHDYIMGKLLGYSDTAMEEYLSKYMFETVNLN